MVPTDPAVHTGHGKRSALYTTVLARHWHPELAPHAHNASVAREDRAQSLSRYRINGKNYTGEYAGHFGIVLMGDKKGSILHVFLL